MRFTTFVKQAELIENRLKTLETQIKSIEAVTTLTDRHINKVKVIHSTASTKNSDFEKLVNKLFATTPLPVDLEVQDNFKTISTLQDRIGDLYLAIHSSCVTLLPPPDQSEGRLPTLDDSNVSQPPITTRPNNIQLPRIQLGTFSGQPENWIAFKNLFENTVHKNDSISSVEKMSYLLSCLEGEALSVVKSLPITNANYCIAWEALNKRFHNSRLLISLHVNNVLDLPSYTNPSVQNLRQFLSVLNENIDALRALEQDISQESLFLTSHLLRKFDMDLRHNFERSRQDTSIPAKLTELVKFIENYCAQLEAANLSNACPPKGLYASHSSSKPHLLNKASSKARGSRTALLVASRTSCKFCNASDHTIYNCKNFFKLTVDDKFNFVKDNKLCKNCLGGKHKTYECNSSHSCLTCKKRHHSLLHFTDSKVLNSAPPTMNAQKYPSSAEMSPVVQSHSCSGTLPNSQSKNETNLSSSHLVGLTSSKRLKCKPSPTDSCDTVLLATALVTVKSCSGKAVVCRGLLDSAAQSTFITEKCAQILSLKRTRSNAQGVDGISAIPVQTKGLCQVEISSLSGEIISQSHPVRILEKITHDLPRAKIAPEVRSKMKHLVLADPTFDTPAPIDILIGADLLARCIKGQVISLGEDMPIAMETIFGYALFGIAPTLKNDQSCNALVTLLTTNMDLHSSLQQFWSLEEPPNMVKRRPTPEEEKCETHFLTTHVRNSEGRYIVNLPFSDDPEKLGDSYQTAVSVFKSLENKFRSNPKFKSLYVNFMSDYLATGHMTLCQNPPYQNVSHYYLPHHGVLKDDKLRVVFNASAPTSSSVSLNNILYPGPKLHNDICDIILKYRIYPVVFSCDIKQMFRQILIQEKDQIFQLIVWRESDEQPLQVYQLATVTYGFTSSPFLANRVVQQLITDEGAQHPRAAAALRDQIYVDDILVGCNSLQEAELLKDDIIQLLRHGGFELRKWSTNTPSLLNDLPPDHRDNPLCFRSSEQPLHSLLGLHWIPNSDVFSYKLKNENLSSSTRPTKRTVLSSISQVYDPIGWLTPVTFWAKSFMQHLWTLGLAWDEPLNNDLMCSWKKFENDLTALEKLEIPRYLGLVNARNIQLHGFSDGSEMGFAACVYVRITDKDENIFTQLLIAKSRVAPLKRVTLPRLELCGAQLLSRLLHYCSALLAPHYKIDSITAWCDSTIVLSWIRTPSYRLKVFVCNRVTEIQEYVPPSLWFHIASSHNPADCGTRGISPSHLYSHPLWWNGPLWLRAPSEQWPVPNSQFLPLESLPETKPHVITILTASSAEPQETHWPIQLLFLRSSSWSTLIHITAYIMRFVHNLKFKTKCSGSLSFKEISDASLLICQLVQQECFAEEISLLKKNQPCSLRIRRLAPFLDNTGIIRVGGRLKNADLRADVKHPILLPKNHHVVNILIDYYHRLYLHAGPILLQAMLISKFWILSARSAIRCRIFKCIRCFKCKPPYSAPFMGDLPKSRVTPTRPFSVSGVDYAGPYLVKQHLLRRVQPIKVYLCIFICFSVKAVHLEIVTDLTADAYLAALTRFTSRRGIITDLYSDNGTNFTGAAEKLRRTFQDLLKEPQTQQWAETFQIKFHFIPPHAPHQGGLWERAVQSAKHHLTRVIGQQILTLEEFITLATRTEAMLNSRPITPMSNDPSDLQALTPGHFLAGGPLMLPLEHNLESIPLGRLNRWQMMQRFSQNLWTRWHKEYLHTLQHRPKWTTPKKNIEVNDFVLIHEDNSPSLLWKTGRVISVTPGQDGVVRVISIKTSTGQLTRPVTKVSVLPLEQ